MHAHPTTTTTTTGPLNPCACAVLQQHQKQQHGPLTLSFHALWSLGCVGGCGVA
jgi:hypothetical protein